jgi:hypothetical protein
MTFVWILDKIELNGSAIFLVFWARIWQYAGEQYSL